MPDEDIVFDLAELSRVFGDSTRLKILCVLLESEMCVCDIAELLNMAFRLFPISFGCLSSPSLKFRREGKP